jgi:putative membrane protein insertion efficiency factor
MGNNEQLGHYVNDPVINRLTAPENRLCRPRISYARAAILAVLFCLFGLLAAYIIAVIRLHNTAGLFGTQVFLYVNDIYPLVLLIAAVACSRFVLIWFVRLYQRYASSETRLRCRFTPSCSEYTVLALKKYGTVVGGIKSVRRLIRCGPSGGIDYP